MLYAAASISDSASLSPAIRQAYTEQLKAIRTGFRQLYPEIDFQIALYPESDFITELLRRADSDLGPDLIITNTLLAAQLFDLGLTDAPPAALTEGGLGEGNQAGSTRPNVEQPLNASAPFAIYPQLACFNKTAITKSPTTTQKLIQMSDAGVRIGLSTQASQLIWSAGSSGALPALTAALKDRNLSKAQKLKLTGWFQWLQQANRTEGIRFLSNHSQLRKALANGELDWISCNSASTTPLRRAMGEQLGVAALPNGTDHKASPVNRVRVLAFGSDSTRQQRLAAERFASYVMSPIVQQNLSRQSAAYLPANRLVKRPQGYAQTFNAMIQAREQAEASEPAISTFNPYSDNTRRLTALLTPLIFGQTTAQDTTQQLLERSRPEP